MKVNSVKQRVKRIFDTHFRLLCIYAEGLVGNREEAEDIVSGVFQRLVENPELASINKSLQAYLYRSVRNQCFDYMEHHQVLQKYIEYVKDNREIYELDDSDPLSMLISKETVIEIEQAIECLPPKCKEIFLLVRMEGLTYKEIAEKLNISFSTVKMQIRRATGKLRKTLEDKEIINITKKK